MKDLLFLRKGKLKGQQEQLAKLNEQWNVRGIWQNQRKLGLMFQRPEKFAVPEKKKDWMISE